MGLSRKRWMAAVAMGGLLAFVALLGAKLAGPASGQATTVRVVVSQGTASVGDSVTVTISIENVTNLGTYEWVLAYNPDVLDLASGNPVNGDFLRSTGRSVSCVPPIVDTAVGTVRFGCTSSAPPDAGPGPGPGVLSTVTFTAKAAGSTSLCLSWASLGDASPYVNDIPLSPSQVVQGASCAPAATPTPATPPPDYTPPSGETPVATATPGGPAATATPGGPVATATPGAPAATATPMGPTPTAAPTPPPESAEVMDLIAGCNPLTTTYPDGTTVQTLTAATAPAGILDAIWKFDAGAWRAYSPEFPEASDLAVTALLDVVFLCVDSPGTFVRPIV